MGQTGRSVSRSPTISGAGKRRSSSALSSAPARAGAAASNMASNTALQMASKTRMAVLWSHAAARWTAPRQVQRYQKKMMPPTETPFIFASPPPKPLERVWPTSPTSEMALVSE